MTLPFPEDRNLARGKKTVASSSENDGAHAAKSVTDGNTGSSWRSGGPGEQWVMVDLGAPTEFSDIVLTWESEAAKAYEILASDDAEEWRTVYTSGKPSTPIDRIRIDPVTARYVKLQGTAPTTTGSWCSSKWSFTARKPRPKNFRPCISSACG